MNDLSIREKLVSAALVVAIVWLGLYPKPVLDTAKPAILKTLNKQKELSYQNLTSLQKKLCEPLWFSVDLCVIKKELTQSFTENNIEKH